MRARNTLEHHAMFASLLAHVYMNKPYLSKEELLIQPWRIFLKYKFSLSCHKESEYFLIFLWRVFRPMPSILAAWVMLPPVLESVSWIA